MNDTAHKCNEACLQDRYHCNKCGGVCSMYGHIGGCPGTAEFEASQAAHQAAAEARDRKEYERLRDKFESAELNAARKVVAAADMMAMAYAGEMAARAAGIEVRGFPMLEKYQALMIALAEYNEVVK